MTILSFPSIPKARRYARMTNQTITATIELKPGVYTVQPDGTLDWREHE